METAVAQQYRTKLSKSHRRWNRKRTEERLDEILQICGSFEADQKDLRTVSENTFETVFSFWRPIFGVVWAENHPDPENKYKKMVKLRPMWCQR